MKQLTDRIARLLTPGRRRFIKFCIVGASGVPVNLLCTRLGYAYLFAGFGPLAQNALSLIFGILISIFTNFLLNDLWTWRDRKGTTASFAGRLMRFYLVCAFASALQFGVAFGLRLMVHLDLTLAQVAGIVLATALNFLLNNIWTFRVKQPLEARRPNPTPQRTVGPAAVRATGNTPH